MTRKMVTVQDPRRAGRLFRELARECDTPDVCQALQDDALRDRLEKAGIEITGFTKVRLICDTDDTIHFVVRRDEMYQASEDTNIDRPDVEYELHPVTRDLYSRFFDDNPDNGPTKRELFEMRIGEYCIGLCM